MIRIISILSILLLLIILIGCAPTYLAPIIPPQGTLITNYKAPLTVNYNGNPAGSNTKKYSMSQTHWFWDFILTGLRIGWGDVDIESIARKANMSEVSFADYEFLSILGVYAQFTVNLYGN